MALIESEVILLGLLLFIPAFAFWLTQKYSIAAKLSAAIICYAIGIALTNLHVIPPDAPIYDSVSTYSVYLSIVIILLSVDIRGWIKTGLAKSAIVSFAIASAIVFVVSIIGGVLWGPKVDPEHGWKLTGMIIGTYTGGSMNLAAVGKALDVPSALFVATNAADLVLFAILLPIQIIIAPYLAKWGFKSLPEDVLLGAREDPELLEKIKKEGYWYRKPWNLYDFAYIMGIGGAVMAVAYAISRAEIFGMWKGAVNILLLTTFALILANKTKASQLVGNEEVAMYLLHMFFTAIAATAYIPTIVKAGPYVAIWILVAIYVSVFFHYVIAGKLIKVDYPTIEVTAQAAIGGPSTALALALALDWPGLAVTAIITGLIGYAIGNYLGVAGAYIVFKLLGIG
ncbi:DUF819 domain-containing protein [Thermococcus sibiricus]|uniref:DUF819 family protein n=1 Tax=Thermococcus sibiricus TaxID=172049 RepID=A0A101EMK1_9EURY|nr:DUF819 family protein [Thermococcus sibiricus]KUK18028.1 MAG: Uncharacterized protein XD54_0644 [Thermococcus sibiricus]